MRPAATTFTITPIPRFVFRAVVGLIGALLIFLPTTAPKCMAVGGVIPGAVHEWVADTDTDGDATWQDAGTQADRDWTLSGAGGTNVDGPQRRAVSTSRRISHAYDFDGVDDAAIAEPENRSGNHDTSYEIWFRLGPRTSPGKIRPLFEVGNAPRGLSLGLDRDTLVLSYGAGGNERTAIAADLGDLNVDRTEFIQAVGVVDDTNDQLRLYINGEHEQIVNLGADSDISSNDQWGLAVNQGRGGGGQNGYAGDWSGTFAGQIAVVREYREAFGVAQVQQNYSALAVPEPVGSGVLGLSVIWALVGLRGLRGATTSLRR